LRPAGRRGRQRGAGVGDGGDRCGHDDGRGGAGQQQAAPARTPSCCWTLVDFHGWCALLGGSAVRARSRMSEPTAAVSRAGSCAALRVAVGESALRWLLTEKIVVNSSSALARRCSDVWVSRVPLSGPVPGPRIGSSTARPCAFPAGASVLSAQLSTR